MNVIKYVKSLRDERGALLSRLAVVEHELDEISSACAATDWNTDAPPAFKAPNGRRKKRAIHMSKAAIEAAILDVVADLEPTTSAVIAEVVGRDCRPPLRSLTIDGRLQRRAWRLRDSTMKPPYYYARTADILDRMEQELISSGQFLPKYVPATLTSTGDHHAGV